MTNNQIIRNEAARLDPATLHAIATAHHTPDEIAAIAAACKTTDENGNEQPATVADVEIMLAADELHTFDHWKKEGKSVKKGEKHLVCCYLWKYTTKPSKEQREKAAAEGKEAAPDPHYYPTKSHLFSCLQVESSKPAPAGRFGSTAAIIEYNKKLAAERKAAKAAAEKAKAEAAAPIIIEEHHELPELVHVDPLPTKKATKRTAKKAPEKLFTASITDMRKPGKDKDGKQADGAVQKMVMDNKDSAFVRVTQLREALNKVSGRIISLTTQIRQQEEFEKRYALELERLDIAKMRATGEVDVDPEGGTEDETVHD